MVPQLAFAYAINSRLNLAFAVVTPSGAGRAKWPDTVTLDNGSLAPAPQRYMLLSQEAVVITPTLAAGYEVLKGVRLGVAFQAVMSFLKFSTASQATASTKSDVSEGSAGDLRADLSVKKLFTPAVVLGALLSPTDDLDIGVMFRAGADIKINDGEVSIQGPFYGNGNGAKNTPATTTAPVKEFRIPQPIDLRVGLRFHPMRRDAKVETDDASDGMPADHPGHDRLLANDAGKEPEAHASWRRDFLANDAFDIELDATYSHNKSFDDLIVLFPPGQAVALGTTRAAGFIPEDASVPHRWRDTVGARLGGEYVVMPGKLGVRAGGFVQSNAQDPQYLSVDFLPSAMFGVYLGSTVRVSKTVDLSAGYGHIFLTSIDNGGDGQLHGLNAQPKFDAAAACTGNPAPYRTCNAINNGRASGNYNMFSLGATFRL
ncbi:MAG: hypothetical protein NVSMB1_18030 [Polyangiales bacterium]